MSSEFAPSKHRQPSQRRVISDGSSSRTFATTPQSILHQSACGAASDVTGVAFGGRAWETFAHGADVGVRGRGANIAEAFANAAVALTSAITDPAAVRQEREVSLACQAPDAELLLYDFLNAVVTAMAVEDLIFGRYDVRIEGDRLTARAFGEPVDAPRHAPAVEVKGATLTELKVACEDGRWVAQCVVDV